MRPQVKLSTLSAQGSWVWMPHEEEMYLPAKVTKSFKPGDPGVVQTEDGEVRR